MLDDRYDEKLIFKTKFPYYGKLFCVLSFVFFLIINELEHFHSLVVVQNKIKVDTLIIGQPQEVRTHEQGGLINKKNKRNFVERELKPCRSFTTFDR